MDGVIRYGIKLLELYLAMCPYSQIMRNCTFVTLMVSWRPKLCTIAWIMGDGYRERKHIAHQVNVYNLPPIHTDAIQIRRRLFEETTGI